MAITKARWMAVLIWLFAPIAYAASPQTQVWTFGTIVVEQGWARLEPDQSNAAKIYLTIHNKSNNDDYLLAVESQAAKLAMIHQANQQPVPGGLTMPSHSEVVMRPDNYHIMVNELSQSIRPGSNLPIRIVLRDAGSFDLSVPVLEAGESDPPVTHRGHGS
ncbi:MAG: copper chaperone PCu(A)C [Pseudomonadota bacterium]